MYAFCFKYTTIVYTNIYELYKCLILCTYTCVVLIDCVDVADVRQTFYNANSLSNLFTNVAGDTILQFYSKRRGKLWWRVQDIRIQIKYRYKYYMSLLPILSFTHVYD
jgi:hypothetical protein